MIDYDKIKAETIGRWRGILSALGIAHHDGKHGPCPSCGGKDRFRFTDLEGKGTYICGQHGAGDGFDLVMKVLNTDFNGACEAISKVIGIAKRNPLTQNKVATPEEFRKLLESSRKVKKNDPVHRYLKERGLKILPPSLWYAPKCYERETMKDQEAMLAIFTAPDGEAITIHRTYIKNGKKLNIQSPKKIMTPLKKMHGGAVRLFDGRPDTLGVCEGIETAIAIREMYGIVTWPCLSAILLEQWEPPSWIHTVRIYADNDSNYTGHKSAYILANRLSLKPYNLRVIVHIAKYNDFLEDLINQ